MMVSKKRCHAFLTCQINIEALQQELNKNRKDSQKKKNGETCDVFNNIGLFRVYVRYFFVEKLKNLRILLVFFWTQVEKKMRL